jgi:hypothetical protein
MEGFESKGTHPLLDSADIHLLNERTDNPNQTTKSLLDASMEAGLEVNVEKTAVSKPFEIKIKFFCKRW